MEDGAVETAPSDEPGQRPAIGRRNGTVSHLLRRSIITLALVTVVAGAVIALIRGEGVGPSAGDGVREGGGTSAFPGAGAEALEPLWRIAGPEPPSETGAVIGGSVVAGDVVVTAADHGLVAVDAGTGDVRWRGSHGRNDAVVVGDDGMIFSGGRAGLGAYEAATGETSWERATADDDSTVPRAERDGLLVAVAHEGDGVVLVGISSEEGTDRWERALDGVVPSGEVVATTEAIVVATDVVADPAAPDVLLEGVPAGPGPVVVLDPTDGAERWRLTEPLRDAWAPGQYTVAAGALIAVTGELGEGGRLVAHDLATGERLWDRVLPDQDGRSVITSGGEEVLAVTGGALTVLDARNGSPRLETELPTTVERVVWDGAIAVLSGDDRIMAVSTGDGTVSWTAAVEAGWVGSVELGDDVAIVATADLVALDISDGSERWRFSAGISCDVARWQGFVVATSGAHPDVIDPEDGQRWRRLLLDRPTGDGPTRVDAAAGEGQSGALLVAATEVSAGSVVYGLDDPAGDVRWIAEPGLLQLQGRPVVSPDATVTLAGSDVDEGATTVLVALDGRSGEERWRTQLRVAVVDQHAAGADRLVLAREEGGLMAVSLEDGSTIWDRDDRGGIVVSTAIADGAVVVTRWDPAEDGVSAASVEVRSLEDGMVRWERPLDDSWPAYLAVAHDGTVLAGAGEPHLHAFALEDGGELWRAELATPLVGGVTVAGDRVHVATVSGLEILGLSDGARLATRETERLVVSAPLPVDGRLIACHADGTVAAYG